MVELGEELQNYRNNVANQVKEAVSHFLIKSEPEVSGVKSKARIKSTAKVTGSNYTERSGSHKSPRKGTSTSRLNLVLPMPDSRDICRGGPQITDSPQNLYNKRPSTYLVAPDVVT